MPRHFNQASDSLQTNCTYGAQRLNVTQSVLLMLSLTRVPYPFAEDKTWTAFIERGARKVMRGAMSHYVNMVAEIYFSMATARGEEKWTVLYGRQPHLQPL